MFEIFIYTIFRMNTSCKIDIIIIEIFDNICRLWKKFDFIH